MANKEEIWKAAIGVWNRIISADVGRAIVQAQRVIMGRVVAEGEPLAIERGPALWGAKRLLVRPQAPDQGPIAIFEPGSTI